MCPWHVYNYYHHADVGDLDCENHCQQEPGCRNRNSSHLTNRIIDIMIPIWSQYDRQYNRSVPMVFMANHDSSHLFPPLSTFFPQHQVLEQRVQSFPEKKCQKQTQVNVTQTCHKRAIWDKRWRSWQPWQWGPPWPMAPWPSSLRECRLPHWSQRWGSHRCQPLCKQQHKWRLHLTMPGWTAWLFFASCRSRLGSQKYDTECGTFNKPESNVILPDSQSREQEWQQRHRSRLQACVWSVLVCALQ